MTYSQKLRDPRWQKVRLKVLDRDGWKCRDARCKSPAETPLMVHHLRYVAGRDPWDYPLTNFKTLCEQCHEKFHAIRKPAGVRPFVAGGLYTWAELSRVLGFTPHGYLTESDGRIVCACIRLDYNPDAPDILLPGTEHSIVAKAKKFCGQTEFIPVLIKAMDADWEYCGRYRVEATTSNAAEIRIHQDRAAIRAAQISMVLYLEKEDSGNSLSPGANPGTKNYG
jgi:hypothetical protein